MRRLAFILIASARLCLGQTELLLDCEFLETADVYFDATDAATVVPVNNGSNLWYSKGLIPGVIATSVFVDGVSNTNIIWTTYSNRAACFQMSGNKAYFSFGLVPFGAGGTQTLVAAYSRLAPATYSIGLTKAPDANANASMWFNDNNTYIQFDNGYRTAGSASTATGLFIDVESSVGAGTNNVMRFSRNGTYLPLSARTALTASLGLNSIGRYINTYSRQHLFVVAAWNRRLEDWEMDVVTEEIRKKILP